MLELAARHAAAASDQTGRGFPASGTVIIVMALPERRIDESRRSANTQPARAWYMPLQLSANKIETRISSAGELRQALALSAHEQFREIWLSAGDDGPSLCALINGERGWLMYLREPGDAGFSSRNASSGDAGGTIEYRLSNGQFDVYPAYWALPAGQLLEAMEYFVEHRARAPFIDWHDDSR